ncbi:MAG: LysR family transcriptional regulator [Burkholderiales bacterium]|nr:LysR family transcriptional regulator [Burkholderiales bacterium]
MDLRQLRYFVAVAEAGHITRAAERLGIRQPPLSQQIKALEAHVGLPLFRRHARGVALTEAGRQLLADARGILRDVAALEERLTHARTGLQGRLSITFTSSAAAHRFTPTVLQACRQTYPGIALVLGEDNAAGILDALAGGRLDCGLLRVPTARPDGIAFDTLLREPLLVALPAGHRLLARRRGGATPTLRLRDLAQEDLILVRRPGAPGLYASLLELCRAAGFEPRVALEVDRMMTNLNLVAAGAGVSVVPASMRGTHAHAVVYCPLADAGTLDAPLSLAYRADELGGARARFVTLARKVAQRYA